MTICLSIAFSRATASAICRSSSLLALTAILVSLGAGSSPTRKSIVVSGLFGDGLAAAPLLAFLAKLLVLPERRPDQIVGEHQPRLGDRPERDPRCRLLAFGGCIALDRDRIGADLGDRAAKTLAVVD